MDILKGIKLVVFDFDGTLFRLDVDWEQLKKTLRVEEKGKRLGQLVQDYTSTNHPDLLFVTEAELAGLRGGKLAVPVQDLLTALREKGYAIAVLTRNSRTVVEAAVGGTIFEDSLEIMGREDVRFLKPDTEGLDVLMRNNGCKATEILVVGDTDHDVEVAHAVGARIAVVHNQDNQYEPAGGDYYIQNLAELMN